MSLVWEMWEFSNVSNKLSINISQKCHNTIKQFKENNRNCVGTSYFILKLLFHLMILIMVKGCLNAHFNFWFLNNSTKFLVFYFGDEEQIQSVSGTQHNYWKKIFKYFVCTTWSLAWQIIITEYL